MKFIRMWIALLLVISTTGAIAQTQTFSASASFSSFLKDSAPPVKSKDRVVTTTDKRTNETFIIVE